MNLKDIDLKEIIKIAIAVTATLLITLNLSIMSNNTTIINNYIQETSKKLDTIEKVNVETQSNISKIKSDINKTLIINQEILKEVD